MSIIMFFFFFFKQKTAYEMRISDWSSDVCSSDLYVIWSVMICDFYSIGVFKMSKFNLFLPSTSFPLKRQAGSDTTFTKVVTTHPQSDGFDFLLQDRKSVV